MLPAVRVRRLRRPPTSAAAALLPALGLTAPATAAAAPEPGTRAPQVWPTPRSMHAGSGRLTCRTGSSRSSARAPTPPPDASSNPSCVTPAPVDTVTGAPGAEVTVGRSAFDVGLDWDGGTAYVTTADENSLVPVDTASGTARAPLKTGAYPLAVALTPVPVE